MPRFALLVGAAALLAATAPLAVATTALAAPQAPAVTCGTHYGPRDADGYYPKYWGNCGTTNTNVTYVRRIYPGGTDRPGGTVCALAGQDVFLGKEGEPLVFWGLRYIVTDVSGTC